MSVGNSGENKLPKCNGLLELASVVTLYSGQRQPRCGDTVGTKSWRKWEAKHSCVDIWGESVPTEGTEHWRWMGAGLMFGTQQRRQGCGSLASEDRVKMRWRNGARIYGPLYGFWLSLKVRRRAARRFLAGEYNNWTCILK